MLQGVPRGVSPLANFFPGLEPARFMRIALGTPDESRVAPNDRAAAREWYNFIETILVH